MTSTLVQKDSRNRIALGSLLKADQYLARAGQDGTIVLEPAVVMSEAELRFLSTPHIVEAVDHSLAHPEESVARPQRRGRKSNVA